MSIVFFGTPEFGAIILEKLVAVGLKPVLVVTQPDRPAGRKQVLTSPPVKVLADKHGILVIQPEKLSSAQFKQNLAKLSLKPDLLVLASYGAILPKEVLELPRCGALNVHPSLLPKYRGPSPIPSAVLAGEETTGVTILLMDEELDHGPIVAQREVSVGTLDALELKHLLAQVGGELLVETIPQWVAETISPQEQNHSQASFTKRFAKEDGRIDWSREAQYIARQIRAFHPWPGTFTTFQGKTLKIVKAQSIPWSRQGTPGMVAEFQGDPVVQTRKGALLLEEIQLEGKKPMPASEFLLGHKDFLGAVLN